ncbi:MAG TPA: 2Fe-2S iron-sulfur cluster binding domain-containing protein [Haploplasma sp.]|nr:2Fe-2S iron-sulfur cluster binding domain-containing protein [Haploplasma sp.]
MNYLYTALILIGVLVVITLFLILMEKVLGSSGSKTITVNEDTQIPVVGDTTVLNALNDNKIHLPSSCGGKGTCGTCKFKLIEGGTPIRATERSFINKKEEAEGVRLSCQVKVQTDLKISLPPGLLNAQIFKAKVVELEDLTYDIKRVRFELIEPSSIDFKPGQFIQITVPGIEVVRAYSIASAPSDNTHLELMIRQVYKGEATTFVHKALIVGDTINIDGPFGDFYLQEDSNKDIICIAGGSGMAPIKSILDHLKERGMKRNIKYFFGARTQEDLFLTEELMELSKQYPNFEYIPALSHSDDDETWKGEKGLITDVVRRIAGDLTNSEAYLCGSPGMIDACINVLQELNMPEDSILFDKF